jgi:hypothetical protein
VPRRFFLPAIRRRRLLLSTPEPIREPRHARTAAMRW